MAYYCPRYYHYYDPVVVKGYQDEYWSMRSNLRTQQVMVDRMIDQVREERRKAVDVTTSKCNMLQSKVNYDATRIDALENELSTWKDRFSNMSDRFDVMKDTLERKDITMDRMRDDLNKCTSTVSDVVSKSKKAQEEYNKLASELRWKQVRAEMDARDTALNLSTMRYYERFRPLYTYRSIYDDLYLYR